MRHLTPAVHRSWLYRLPERFRDLTGTGIPSSPPSGADLVLVRPSDLIPRLREATDVGPNPPEKGKSRGAGR